METQSTASQPRRARFGIPYAPVNPDGTTTCPVCGDHIAEEHDVDGERLTNGYGWHYEREHEHTPEGIAWRYS